MFISFLRVFWESQEDVNNNTYEAVAYIKALYNVDFLDNKIRFGLGEGGSYTTSILEVEYDDVHLTFSNRHPNLNIIK